MKQFKELDITQLLEWSRPLIHATSLFDHFCVLSRMVGYKSQIILWQYSTMYRYIANDANEADERT